MAVPSSLFSLSFPFDPQIQIQNLSFSLSLPSHFSLFSSTKPRFPAFKLSSSHSSSSPLTTTFLTDDDLRRLSSLESFLYRRELPSGSLSVRLMRPHETRSTVLLLAHSFAESLLIPAAYVNLLAFLINQYLLQRLTLLPNTATLVAFYTQTPSPPTADSKEDEEEPLQEDEGAPLAGTVEICFNKRGANASVPTPTPPRDSPYICNMAVEKSLRRRGIGWHLLKASEELISQMSSSKEVYLHCRMIDEAPFKMYTKADYKVVKTDSILVLLMLQRRKHLMCKELPLSSMTSESDLSEYDEQKTI
ncbi:Acyl-CoA N-acyltransferase [Vigna unguiculata]|uniref:Acyl-CoA N-acyltransferase n=1 Tax=Vigna unguiculata TaxID=3917 RepID=A0A4D6LQC4_VIGUN|nr:Acyl-CoA N-acyltransferase [Vigna unguiculata]